MPKLNWQLEHIIKSSRKSKQFKENYLPKGCYHSNKVNCKWSSRKHNHHRECLTFK